MIPTGPIKVRASLGFLYSQDIIFQVNIYVIDIVWKSCGVYVWRSKLMVL